MSNPVLNNVRASQSGTLRGSGSLNLDDVVTSTGFLLALTAFSAVATAFVVPPATQMVALSLGGLIAFGMCLVLMFTQLRFNPVAVGVFAALEGVVLGALSNAYAYLYDGVVIGAVAGTTIGFAGMLAAYKFFDLQLSSKTRKIVIISMWGFIGVALFDVVLLMLGSAIGFNGFGPLGIAMSLVGVVLSAFFMLMDFQDVEAAIAAGAGKEYRWALGLGLLISLVWMYTNLLHLLGALSND